jgi:phage terminase Nu1 subunit (DNA packaging protein)
MAVKSKKAPASSADKWLVTTTDVAEVFQVSTRAVRKWKEAGCPQEARGKWNLRKVVAWRMDMFTPDDDADPNDLKKREAVAETRWKEERAAVKQIEREIMEGKYHHHDDIEEAWASRAAEMKAGLGNLVKRMPPELREEVRGEVHDFLVQYSRDGKYTPAPK